jgi:hypothetical protein
MIDSTAIIKPTKLKALRDNSKQACTLSQGKQRFPKFEMTENSTCDALL